MSFQLFNLGLGAVLGVLSASLPVVISEIVAYIAEHRFSQLKEAFQKHLIVGSKIGRISDLTNQELVDGNETRFLGANHATECPFCCVVTARVSDFKGFRPLHSASSSSIMLRFRGSGPFSSANPRARRHRGTSARAPSKSAGLITALNTGGSPNACADTLTLVC